MEPENGLPAQSNDCLPLQHRALPITSVKPETRTADVVFTTGASVERYDWRREETYLELLEVSPAAIDLTRLNSGAPVLNSHIDFALDAVLGVVERAWIEGNQGWATIRFPKAGTSEKADEIFALVSDGIIRNVSVGYRINEAVREVDQNGVVTWRVTRWEPHEISLVAVGADAKASVRAESKTVTYPLTLNQRALPASQETRMEPENVVTPAPVAPASVTPAPVIPAVEPAPVVQESRSAPPASLSARDAADLVRRAALLNIGVDEALKIAESARSMSEATNAMFEHAAQTSQTAPVQRAATRVMRDEGDVLMTRFRRALEFNLAPSRAAAPAEDIREFLDFSLVEMAAHRLGERRVPNSFGDKEQILYRAFHTTSDFPILFEGALNSSLAARYATATATYRSLARQRTYVDFRAHPTLRPGDMPKLQKVSPAGGEIKSGTFTESKESTFVETYGVRLDFSLEMLINDRLNSLQYVLNDQANSVLRREEELFYEMMFSGSGGNGPTLLETSRQVFNTTDKTLSASGTAIDVAALSAGRAEFRKRTNKSGTLLNITPRIILVGPDKETQAQQLLSPIQAQQAGNVNPFPNTLTIVPTPYITGNAWFLLADPSEAPVFEWGLLDGRTAPIIRYEEPFGVLGTSMSVQHHFGCGAIDFRGAYKNAGA